jgi:hypothetical protein
VLPPDKGERWISDTKLRGFGLRLWATRTGAGKAFGVRVARRDGKRIRKTFESHDDTKVGSGDLSDRLQLARDWARNQINIAKGRATLEHDRQRQRLELDRQRQRGSLARKVRALTLERAAHAMICGMLTEGRSRAYTDRLNKLFGTQIPKSLRVRLLDDVHPRELACALSGLAVHRGNLRILKSFIGQIYNRAAKFDGVFASFTRELSVCFWEEWKNAGKLQFPELGNLGEADYQAILSRLETREDRWQQSLCLRLFFEFGAPLTRLMSAQWWQLYEGKWYPYLPHEKLFWLESAEPVSPNARALIRKAALFARKNSFTSRFWFPSSLEPSRPISSVQSLWRDTLTSVGSRYYPLTEFARSFRQPNNPSYSIGFVRQYAPHLRRNVAKVSKALYDQHKNLSCSYV